MAKILGSDRCVKADIVMEPLFVPVRALEDSKDTVVFCHHVSQFSALPISFFFIWGIGCVKREMKESA